ncbi:hypothetical protein [Phocaeicola salanitronis]|uniref:hypothetical protein n=1 Tax=Phocaeicola salanitronis TaxID=376805 RepID=UPI0023F89084|nr:hypothetical protein [Phocaeicola salanitronis]
MNESQLNAAMLNTALLNASIEARGTGSILPPPSEDTYVLDNAILLDSAGSVLLTEDGTPIVYN